MINERKLISLVALAHIRRELTGAIESQSGSLRLCTVGLDHDIVKSICEAVVSDVELQKHFDVWIPRSYGITSQLLADHLTDQPASHWRNSPLSHQSKCAVLFAVTIDEQQSIGHTLETVRKIETDLLRSLYDDWIEGSGLRQYLTTAHADIMRKVLQAINSSEIAITITNFESFIVSVCYNLRAGKNFYQSLDDSLHTLKIPCNSGQFGLVSEARKQDSSFWEARIQHTYRNIRPYVYFENSKGEDVYATAQENYKIMNDRNMLTESQDKVVLEFLGARERINWDNWCPEQDSLVREDWQDIKPLFEGIVQEAVPLHIATSRHFDVKFPTYLTDEWIEFLQYPLPRDPSDSAFDFFEIHRIWISYDPKLLARWEKYLYKSPRTYGNFYEGVIDSLKRIRNWADVDSEQIKLRIRLVDGDKHEFWLSKNTNVMRFFATRYHGLDRLGTDRVVYDFGHLEKNYYDGFEALDKDNTSLSKKARTLQFEVGISTDKSSSDNKMIFYWDIPNAAIPLSLPHDLRQLCKGKKGKVLLYAPAVSVQLVSSKGLAQELSLQDCKTMCDVYDGQDGRFVWNELSDYDINQRFHDSLKIMVSENIVPATLASRLVEAFSNFADKYSAAIHDWTRADGPGITSRAFIEQATAYGALLELLCGLTNSQRARRDLLSLVLKVGVAKVGENADLAIVLPWQPLRMAELHIKAMHFHRKIEELMAAPLQDIFLADRYYDDFMREVKSMYYPEVCVGVSDRKFTLLSLVDNMHGYSLAEPPINLAERGDYSRVSPDSAAACFADVSRTYLDLVPHECANFSAILFNAEPLVPKAVAEQLASMVETESQLQCDLLLTHINEGKMRRQYGLQNMKLSDVAGSRLASETAMNFLSRLRVGVVRLDGFDMVPEAERRADVVFLQDVVADFGRVKWRRTPIPCSNWIFSDHIPSNWSKRKPTDLGDVSATVYMASPAQPMPCQQYLNALHSLTTDSESEVGDLIPAKEIDFDDADVKDLFEKVHQVGDWVINFDELVDRRLLERKGVRTIRNIFNREAGRNIIVSTKSSTMLLERLLVDEIIKLIGSIDRDKAHWIADILIRRAASLSGHVVMKAAKHGHHAKELIGLVLSMERISLLFPSDKIGWFFLDDYLALFGQSEERIADTMAIVPLVEDGKPHIGIIICEAKYVGASGHSSAKLKSAKQLSETVRRLVLSLEQDNGHRIDRPNWLARISNMMVDHMEDFGHEKPNNWNLRRWSEGVRNDEIPIKLLGVSHVFLSDEEAAITEDASMLSENYCAQVVLPYQSVKRQLLQLAGVAGEQNVVREAPFWASSAMQGSSTYVESVGSMVNDTSDHEHSVSNVSVDAPDTISMTGAADPVSVPSKPVSNSELEQWLSVPASSPLSVDAEKWLESSAVLLKRALLGYDLDAQLLDKRLTPNASIVKLKGTDNLTVQKVEKKRQELLTTHGLDVISVEAAPGQIFVKIRRPDRQVLHLRELWKRRTLGAVASLSNDSILIGETESEGLPLYLNIGSRAHGFAAHAPHTLIAGETGGGKGVLVQTILLDICATNSPSNAQITMIDPKKAIEYAWLKQLPHLKGPIVTEQAKAIQVLGKLTEEMNRRYELFGIAGAKDLSSYNRKVGEASAIPRMWLFHEEFSDWMLEDEYRSAVETYVSRLGVKSRAAGINLVMIAQRPDNRVFPMQLRANLSNRLILKMADRKNSELVLDEPGAENLLGQGHMAAKLSGESGLIYAQVPFIDDVEIEELMGIVRRMWD